MIEKTTLIQIAEAAGVSLSTVDRVLNRRGGVSSDAREKVLMWAGRLNIDRVIYRDDLRLLRIAVIMQSATNPFYKGLQEAFIEMNNVMQEFKLSFFIHYFDVADAMIATSKITQISASYDAVIIISPDDPRLSESLSIISKRIPVVTMVTDLPDSGRIAYIGPDNRQIGRVAGELMGRFLGPPGGEIIIVLGMQRFVGHDEREMGFRSVLQERFATCSIFSKLESGEDRERAGRLVYEALKSNPAVRGIYNVSDGNLEIAHAINALGLKERIVLITHELTPERRAMLCEGAIDAIIDQNPRQEARRALEVLCAHFKRTNVELPSATFTEFNIFIRESCQ